MRTVDFLRASFRIGKLNNDKSFDTTILDCCSEIPSTSSSSTYSSSATPFPRRVRQLKALKNKLSHHYCSNDHLDEFSFERRKSIHYSHFSHRGPISKTLTFLRNKMDTALSTSTLYPTRDDVRQWENCFESLLQNKFGCALFRQFLKKEFSDENVDFWLECEEFKKMKDGKKSTTQKAYEIYKEFVAEHAPKEVNLDSDTRAATKAALENGCKTDTFSLAQNRVEQLMSKDSYRRFLRDRLFLDLVESFDHEKDKETKETTPKEK